MKVAILAPIHSPIPPIKSGGTELFIASLVEALRVQGVDVTLYNDRTGYPKNMPTEWNSAFELNHIAESLNKIVYTDVDILHVNSPAGVAMSKYIENIPKVCTIHHPYEEGWNKIYDSNPDVQYVFPSKSAQVNALGCIVENEATVIHHGINFSNYPLVEEKADYLCFLGRLVPEKGIETAVKIAQKADCILKVGGTLVKETNYSFFQDQVNINYLGELDFYQKIDLLSNSKGLLFPVNWKEPFGLVMIEAMACGTPVYAFDRGSVSEVVQHGVTGYIHNSVFGMVESLKEGCPNSPGLIRETAQRRFSSELMAKNYIKLYNKVS